MNIFTPKECGTHVSKEGWELLEAQFNEKCRAKSSCTIDLSALLMSKEQKDLRPPQCKTNDGRLPQDFAYLLQVQCIPPQIVVPFISDKRIDLDVVALTCVCSDLLIILLLYISLLLLESFQNSMISDVQESILTADDFSVCIKELPVVPIEKNEQMNQLKAMMWAWVENILKLEGGQYLNPEDAQDD